MTLRGIVNKNRHAMHKSQTKEKQINQLSLPKKGDHYTRQDLFNTTIRQRKVKKSRKCIAAKILTQNSETGHKKNVNQILRILAARCKEYN